MTARPPAHAADAAATADGRVPRANSLPPSDRIAPEMPARRLLYGSRGGREAPFAAERRPGTRSPEGRFRGPTRGNGARPRRAADENTTAFHEGGHREDVVGHAALALVKDSVGMGGGRGQRRGSFIGGRSPKAPRALAAYPAEEERAGDPRDRPLVLFMEASRTQ